MEAIAAVAGITPEMLGCATMRRQRSRLVGSAGRLSKGRLKRATLWPRHLECGAGAGGDSKQRQELPSILRPLDL